MLLQKKHKLGRNFALEVPAMNLLNKQKQKYSEQNCVRIKNTGLEIERGIEGSVE